MLPEPETRLPRAKPVPKAKPLTRWQQFALAKGITKKKKDRMVWDEAAGEFKPRWGYKVRSTASVVLIHTMQLL